MESVFLLRGHSEVKAHREEAVICIHCVKNPLPIISLRLVLPDVHIHALAGFKLRLQERE